jgi:hypothetical protein
MLKVPPAKPTLAIVGFAVKVSDVTLVPVPLETVIVAFFVVVFPGVVVRTGAENVIEAPDTVNAAVRVAVPPEVLTVTLWAPSVAPAGKAKFAFRVVELTRVTVLTVTPVPAAIVVAAVKLVPVKVTPLMLVPRTTVAGRVVDVSVGGGKATLKFTALLTAPPPFVTVTVLTVSWALAAIVRVAVTEVSLTAVKPLTVTRVPDTVTVVAPVRFTPVIVTGTTAPGAPDDGEIEVRVGAFTVNALFRVKVIPLMVWTVTFLAWVKEALAAIVKIAETLVSLSSVNPLTVIPVPVTVRPVADVNPAPVNVRVAAVPRMAISGGLGTCR